MLVIDFMFVLKDNQTYSITDLVYLVIVESDYDLTVKNWKFYLIFNDDVDEHIDEHNEYVRWFFLLNGLELMNEQGEFVDLVSLIQNLIWEKGFWCLSIIDFGSQLPESQN